MLKRVLCPTDGSEHAEKAVSLASDLAAKYDAELVLLHVQLDHAAADELQHFAQVEGLAPSLEPELDRMRTVESQAPLSGGAPAHEPVSTDILERVAEYALESAVRIAASKGVDDVSAKVERGDTGKRILAVAKREGADMIVMGSRGLGRLEGLLRGSTSQYVNGRADCTCVTVN